MENGAVILGLALLAFAAGYFVYSRFLGRVVGIDPGRKTPAVAERDDVDYMPAHPLVLFGHHFAAIAGAGPIVGPVFAAEFGWGAVALWVILGSVFIGAMHDMLALFLSVRHHGKSIGVVIGELIGAPARILFLMFSWSVLVLVVAEFTRQIAITFVSDPAIATSSMLFIAEAVVFGLCVYRLRMSLVVSSLIFVPLMFASVWIGELYPLDLTALGLSADATRTVWILILLGYCFLASVCPIWVLLQPRGYLSSYLLYVMAALGIFGVLVAHPTLTLPAFTGFSVAHGEGCVDPLFPLLFVLVSCGACSGTHAIIASGTTSKQLANERHIRPIGYGGLLLEGVLAIVAIVAIAGVYATSSDYFADIASKSPAQLFASAIAGFCAKVGIPLRLSSGFILLSISAFLMTTVDACARLARFSWQELAVWAPKPVKNTYAATTVVCAAAAVLLLGNSHARESLWAILMSANQLIAALTLLAATLWLARNRKPRWMTFLPMLFMFVVSVWALWLILLNSISLGDVIRTLATGFLLLLAIVLVVLAVLRKNAGTSLTPTF